LHALEATTQLGDALASLRTPKIQWNLIGQLSSTTATPPAPRERTRGVGRKLVLQSNGTLIRLDRSQRSTKPIHRALLYHIAQRESTSLRSYSKRATFCQVLSLATRRIPEDKTNKMYRPFLLLSLVASAAVGVLATDEELGIDVTLPVECERKTKSGDRIDVHYRGTLQSNGEKFDASESCPLVPLPTASFRRIGTPPHGLSSPVAAKSNKRADQVLLQATIVGLPSASSSAAAW